MTAKVGGRTATVFQVRCRVDPVAWQIEVPATATAGDALEVLVTAGAPFAGGGDGGRQQSTEHTAFWIGIGLALAAPLSLERGVGGGDIRRRRRWRCRARCIAYLV